MSSEAPFIQARGLGKAYAPLTGWNALRHLFLLPAKEQGQEFWALRNLSFDLSRGKVLGIVGNNGSGKSTLLQLTAGLLRPSEGHIKVQGRCSALLELGAGFNPEFSGRENALHSSTIYGFDRSEAEARLEQILAFADIGDHIDAPVKTYSSGMYARLAFAVAVNADPDLLLVDEVLAVGDVAFQARCYRRIEEMKSRGTSILFVSHDLNNLKMFADEVLLLDRGQMLAKGDPRQVIDTYLERLANTPALEPQGRGQPDGEQAGGRFLDFCFTDSQGNAVQHPLAGERYVAEAEFEALYPMEEPVFSLQVQTLQGVVVYDTSTLMKHQPVRSLKVGERLRLRAELTLNLAPGPFRIGFGAAILEGELPRPLNGTPQLTFEVIAQQPAYGFANLYSNLELHYEN